MPKAKTLQDYQDLAKLRGGKYVNTAIPNRVMIPTDGWECSLGHRWTAKFNHINHSGSWCPECSRRSRSVHLAQYQEVAKDRGGEYILDATPGRTDMKAIDAWKCAAGHIWSAAYNNVSRGRWCKTCWLISHRKTINDYRELASERSGEYILDQIPATVDTIADDAWKCSSGHVWSARYADIKDGKWCPSCRFKSETCARTIIEKILGVELPKSHPTFLRNEEGKHPLELDGYNEDLKIAFEYQGRQHFEKIEYWRSDLKNQQERDRRKYNACAERGISLLLIPYQFTYRDPRKMEVFIFDQLIALGYILVLKGDDLTA